MFQTETALFADALTFVSQAIEELALEGDITTEPLDCNNDRQFDMGKIIVEKIKNVSKSSYELTKNTGQQKQYFNIFETDFSSYSIRIDTVLNNSCLFCFSLTENLFN